MKKLILVLLVTVSSVNLIAQDKKLYDDSVKECIKESRTKDALKATVDNCIKGTYISDYSFTTLDGKVINTKDIKKPIMLLTAATWCAPCWAEVPAINNIVKKYGNKVEFIMLFWDTKKGVERMAEKLDKKINLVPSETENKDRSTISIGGFVHKLDYPASYLIGKNKKIINFKRGCVSPTKKKGWDVVTKINEKEFIAFLRSVL